MKDGKQPSTYFIYLHRSEIHNPVACPWNDTTGLDYLPDYIISGYPAIGWSLLEK